MDITNEGGGMTGGIAGDIGRNVVVEWCLYYGNHLTGEGGHILANYASGGIVGRACDHYSTSEKSSASGGFGNTVRRCIVGYLSFKAYDGAARTTSVSYSNGPIVGYTNIYNTFNACTRLRSGTGGVTRTFQWYKDTTIDTKIMTDASCTQAASSSSSALTNVTEGLEYDVPFVGQYNSNNTKMMGGVMTSLNFAGNRVGTWNFSDSASCMPSLTWESE